MSSAGTRYECIDPFGFDPSVSADGRLIAEVRAGAPSQAYTVRPDGTHVKRLTHTTSADNFGATFSPDGRRILYFQSHGDHDGAYVVNADGSGARQLTSDSALGPVFSPNGSQIAYFQSPGISVARGDGGGSHVVLANQRTTMHGPLGGATVTLRRSSVVNSEPNWSPNGTPARVHSGVGPQQPDVQPHDAAVHEHEQR